MRLILPVVATLLLAACQRDAAPTTDSAASTPAPPATTPSPITPAPVPPPSTDIPPAFVDYAWRAVEGSGVEPGATYTFQRDGILIVSSPSGTPVRGNWRFVDGALTMTEDNIDYPTDIVAQDADHLHLRSNNPGGAVDLVLERVQ